MYNSARQLNKSQEQDDNGTMNQATALAELITYTGSQKEVLKYKYKAGIAHMLLSTKLVAHILLMVFNT